MKTPVFARSILIGGPADGEEVVLCHDASSYEIAGKDLTCIHYLRHEFVTYSPREKRQAIFVWSGMTEDEMKRRASELSFLWL